jgi:hypothetical protein
MLHAHRRRGLARRKRPTLAAEKEAKPLTEAIRISAMEASKEGDAAPVPRLKRRIRERKNHLRPVKLFQRCNIRN